jgi:excisionase family DNA binding protein
VDAVRLHVERQTVFKQLEFCTPPQVAVIVGSPCSVRTVLAAIKAGTLEAVRVGRAYRIRPDAIGKWLTPKGTR